MGKVMKAVMKAGEEHAWRDGKNRPYSCPSFDKTWFSTWSGPPGGGVACRMVSSGRTTVKKPSSILSSRWKIGLIGDYAKRIRNYDSVNLYWFWVILISLLETFLLLEDDSISYYNTVRFLFEPEPPSSHTAAPDLADNYDDNPADD
ncbi:hypothetical protein LZ554_008537 [Drepanopeziza brunnea f. sp. 'monogermtubi']|nr:hypothetical protein LZ554_008537 [Drepanopeziza brunnea f. sp. 'monogermtubi']